MVDVIETGQKLVHLDLILETKNPTINEVIPAQTASKAVDIDTKVGSSPLSIKAGILWRAIVPIAK